MQQPMKHPHDPPPPPPPPMAAKRPVSAFGKANPLQHPRGALGMKRPMGKALPRPMLPTLAREPVAVENGDKSDDGNGTPLSHASDGATMRSSPPREVVEAGEGDVSVSAELTVDQPQPLEASSSSPVLPATEVAQADDDVPDSVTDVPTTAAPIMTELLTSPRASSPSPGQPPADQVPQRAGSSQMQPASELRRLVASPAGLESQRGGSTGSSAPSLAPPPLPGPQRGGAPASRESSVVVNPSKMAPKEQTEKEATVVAQGASPQVLQLPSPVYCAEWMDDTHVLICAGGGGKRFGMANIVVLLTVLAGSENSVSGVVRLNAKQQSSVQRAKAPGAAPEQNSLWRCEAAVDLGGDIPWCATKYLPVEDALSQRPSSAPSDLVGFIGISSITSMLLVSVHRSQGSSSSCFTLQRCARVTVPHDLTNPDKKPIALVRNALVVAHDHKAVCIYSLADLVPWSRSPATAMVEEAAPLAEWPVPARVNDLDANRFHLVFTKNPKEERTGRSGSVAHQGTSKDTTGRSQSAAGGPAEGASASTDAKLSCTALVHEYVLISAAIQDKTLRLATFRWRRCFEEANVAGGQAAVERTPLPISENLALSGKDCRLPFALMGSSLRLVRLFGFEQVPPSGRDEALRRMTLESLRQHRQGQSSDSTAVASLVFVAYDSRGNASYLGNVQIFASSGPHKASTEGNDEGRHRKRLTGLQVRMNAAPTAIVEDGVTSLSPIFPLPQEARQHPHGLVVPQRWLVGTVEGWIAEVGPKVDSGGEGHTATPARTAKSSDLDLMLVHRRPSVERRVARQFPSLHKEPISAVAVSANNVVISTDIAQNVVITTLPPPSGKTKEPLVFPLFPEPSSLLAVMLASTTVQRGLILLVSLFILLVALLLA